MEVVIGTLAVLYVFLTGYVMPVVAVFIHYGTIWGIISLVVPVVLLFESGCIGAVLKIAWFVFSAIALVAVFGWWSTFAFIGWALLLTFAVILQS